MQHGARELDPRATLDILRNMLQSARSAVMVARSALPTYLGLNNCQAILLGELEGNVTKNGGRVLLPSYWVVNKICTLLLRASIFNNLLLSFSAIVLLGAPDDVPGWGLVCTAAALKLYLVKWSGA